MLQLALQKLLRLSSGEPTAEWIAPHLWLSEESNQFVDVGGRPAAQQQSLGLDRAHGDKATAVPPLSPPVSVALCRRTGAQWVTVPPRGYGAGRARRLELPRSAGTQR